MTLDEHRMYLRESSYGETLVKIAIKFANACKCRHAVGQGFVHMHGSADSRNTSKGTPMLNKHYFLCMIRSTLQAYNVLLSW